MISCFRSVMREGAESLLALESQIFCSHNEVTIILALVGLVISSVSPVQEDGSGSSVIIESSAR